MDVALLVDKLCCKASKLEFGVTTDSLLDEEEPDDEDSDDELDSGGEQVPGRSAVQVVSKLDDGNSVDDDAGDLVDDGFEPETEATA